MEAYMSDFRDQVTDRPPRASRAPEYLVRRAEPAAAPPLGNPRSTASIAGHPIHPMLIPFPIAFFVATFVCDLVTGKPDMPLGLRRLPGCSAPASSWLRWQLWPVLRMC